MPWSAVISRLHTEKSVTANKILLIYSPLQGGIFTTCTNVRSVVHVCPEMSFSRYVKPVTCVVLFALACHIHGTESEEDHLSLCLHMGRLVVSGINYSCLNHYLCLIVSLFPTVPWEELISVPCTHLPAPTTLNLCILRFDSYFPQSYWSGFCSETVANCCVCGSFEVISHDLEYSPEMWERSEWPCSSVKLRGSPRVAK